MIRALTSPLLPVGRAVHRRLRGVLRLLWRPPKGSLQTYRAEFPDTARAFQRFIARSVPFPEPQAGPPVGIVVSPWVATPVPWYSIAIGMGLARRGRRVTLIHDDTLTAPESPAELLPQHRAICRVTQLLTGHLPTITLTSQAVHALSPADEHEVARLA